MRFLILGASGFVGRHLWKLLTDRQCEVLGTQSRTSSPQLARFDLAQDRILNSVPNDFFAGGDCFVVHAAGFGSPDQCARQQARSRLVNVQAVQQMVEDLAPFSVRHIYLSSSYVFDGKTGRYRECDPCHAICEYGRQKIEMERYLLDRAANVLILRLDKVVGDDPGERHLFAEWNNQLEQGQHIRCIREQTLSPIHVDDVATFVWEACRKELRGVFHVSGTERLERAALARQFQQAISQPGRILEEDAENFHFADPRPLHSDLDGRALREATGFQPLSVQQILARLIR
jgi:dTDP-4-dehydrorhamnose reductase